MKSKNKSKFIKFLLICLIIGLLLIIALIGMGCGNAKKTPPPPVKACEPCAAKDSAICCGQSAIGCSKAKGVCTWKTKTFCP